MSDPFHKVIRISEDTFCINESDIANAYLLLGEKKALLIDSGVGVGNIRATVETITSLPVTLVLTHLHCDHAGGRDWFPSFAYHRNDNRGIYYFESSKMASHYLLKMRHLDLKLSKKPYHAKRCLFDDRMVFDLGGRLIRVMNVPGHTAGSVVFLDERDHLMFTGDDINSWLWLQLPGCSSVAAWLPGAKKLFALMDEYTAYCGHSDAPLNKTGVLELITCGEELLKGARYQKVSSGVFTYPDNDWQNHAVIWFKKIK